MIKNGVNPLVQGATDAQRTTYNEEKKKDFKALVLIHQCVDGDNFKKVGDCESSKQAWEILEKAYARADMTKVVRSQTHKIQLELIQMKENEIINDFTTRITQLVNQVKACGETIMKQYVDAKIFRYLTPKFDNVVVAIEESKDLTKMSKEELQSFLEAHEKMMEERNNDKAEVEIALQTRFNENDKRSKGKWPMKSKGNFRNFYGGVPKVPRIRIVKGV